MKIHKYYYNIGMGKYIVLVRTGEIWSIISIVNRVFYQERRTLTKNLSNKTLFLKVSPLEWLLK